MRPGEENAVDDEQPSVLSPPSQLDTELMYEDESITTGQLLC